MRPANRSLASLTFVVLAACASACRDSSPRPPALRAFTTAILSDPKTFNPILITDSASSQVIDGVFEGLLTQNPFTLEYEPVLASGWEYDEDGTQLTVRLRAGVRWHDGEPFDADDVAFTFRAIFDDRVANSSKHILTVDGEPIGVEVVDPRTVRFTTPRPFAPLLSALGQEILPEHLLGPALENGSFTRAWGIDTVPAAIVGTGPYLMSRYVPAQFVALLRNPTYWRKDDAGASLPYIERRVILIVPNQDTMYLKLVSGEIDELAPRPEEVESLRLRADELGLVVEEIGLETGQTFVVFNRNPQHYVRDGEKDPRLAWFTDRNFMRAIAHAVDRRSMVVNCLSGYGQPATASISPENRLFHRPDLPPYRYDLDEAARLLREGGYEDRDGDGTLEDAAGNRVAFSLTTNAGNQIREKMSSILKNDWEQLGIEVHYRPLDFTTLVEKLDRNYDWDAVLIGFTGGPEPHNGVNMLRSSGNLHMWHPKQETPVTAWEREIDELIEKGSRELDREKRKRFYWRIQEILHEQLPLVQLVRQKTFIARRRSLENYRRSVWGQYRPDLLRFAE